MVDFSKPVQTRSGIEVELLTTEGRGRYPVVGYVGREDLPATWAKDGRYQSSQSEHRYDLMNVPEKRYVWLNVYEHGEYVHTSKEVADAVEGDCSTNRRIARIKVEITPGQFDD